MTVFSEHCIEDVKFALMQIYKAWYKAESKQNPSDRLVSYTTRAAEMVEEKKRSEAA